MAATIETPAQFERDLRSAHKPWKRSKDSKEKWAKGIRPAAGAKWDFLNAVLVDNDEHLPVPKGFKPAVGVEWNVHTGEIMNHEKVPEHMLSKSRPIRNNPLHSVQDSHRKKNANSMKTTRPHSSTCGAINGRPSGRLGARGDIEDTDTSRSLVDLLVPAARKEGGGASWGLHSMDGVLYSFDAKDTPSRPVTLETFVKANNRTTEKLVEKEYEILDVNGELLKGRKARSDLRKSAGGVSRGGGDDDDDDFELV